MDLNLHRAGVVDSVLAIDLLRFGQDRHTVASAEFPSVQIDLHGASDTERAEQRIDKEIFYLGPRGKAEKQEQYPHE